MSTMNVLDASGATVAVEKPLTPGQTTMALSRPVVIASDQSAISVSGTVGVSGFVAVTGTFFQATQPVSGTITANAGTGTFAVSAASLPLPTGAATAANQATLNALFPSSLGTKTAANSLAVTLASDGALTTAFGAQADVAAASGAAGSAMAYLRALKDAATSPTPNLVSDANTGEYETVAASQTDQAMGATGGVGDYFSHIIIVPATTSPGAVSIKDGAGSAITIFAGGASSVTSLAPITVALDLKSLSGAWKVTTGTNVSAISVGNFT